MTCARENAYRCSVQTKRVERSLPDDVLSCQLHSRAGNFYLHWRQIFPRCHRGGLRPPAFSLPQAFWARKESESATWRNRPSYSSSERLSASLLSG